jgi:two-component system chemotaxis response regulator CheB
VIAIGASTGGTEAIADILPRLPKGVPGMVITQHIPAGFSRAFATRLNQMCAFEVKEAEDGDTLCPGRALVAPEDMHMLLRKNCDGYRVAVKTGPRVCYQRPSVDVMFSSVADAAGVHGVGVLLTGMVPMGRTGCSRRVRQARELLWRMNPPAWSSACQRKPSAQGRPAAWSPCPESRRPSWRLWLRAPPDF